MYKTKNRSLRLSKGSIFFCIFAKGFIVSAMHRNLYCLLIVFMVALIGTPTIANTSIPTDSLSIAADTAQTDSIVPPPEHALMLLDRDSYHIGLIKDNTKPTTHTFFYCNGGLEGLVIKRIEATCGCHILEYPTDSLYYDQSGSIVVAVTPCKESTTFKKGIYLYTNAGTFRLLLSGEFAQPYAANEDYSAIPTEEEMQQVLLIDESTKSKKKKKNKKKERATDSPDNQITE